VVDAYSRHVRFYGLPDKSTKAVVSALTQYQADNKPASKYGYMNLDKIRSDAGSQFTSAEFAEYCRDHQIHLSLAAPKKQYQNHLVECTWQTTSTIAHTLLVHAKLPDTFWYHAMVYATDIFNVLPVRGMKNEQYCPATPYELFFSEKPSIAHVRVFGCPTVVRQWVTKQSSQGKQTERDIHGIFLGFNANNKGYNMIYSPGSWQIVTSEDVSFDEHFNLAIATTWQQYRDSLALRPVESYIPVVSETIEHTGNIDDFQPEVEEGEEPEPENSSSDDESTAPKAIVAPPAPQPDSHPYVLDSSSSNQTLRRSTRNRKPNPRYAGSHFSNAVAWANTCSDQDLVEACAAEAQPAIMPDSQDAYSWEPAPKSIRDILKMFDGVVKTGWLKSVKKEMGTLVNSGTLVLDEMREGESSTPVMEIFKVKINSDGSLDK